MSNNKAKLTKLKTNFLSVAIFIELILWVTFSTFFGSMIEGSRFRPGPVDGFHYAAIVSFVFATMTTLTMLGLEVHGTFKKHTELIISCIVIRSIRLWIFICISVAARRHQPGWVAISIIFTLWDLFRIISEFKIISLIKKDEDNTSSTETTTKFDEESPLESIKTLGEHFQDKADQSNSHPPTSYTNVDNTRWAKIQKNANIYREAANSNFFEIEGLVRPNFRKS